MGIAILVSTFRNLRGVPTVVISGALMPPHPFPVTPNTVSFTSLSSHGTMGPKTEKTFVTVEQ